MLPLLADRARSECARSMRAVGSTCTHSAVLEGEEEERPPTKAAFLFVLKETMSNTAPLSLPGPSVLAPRPV